MPTPPIAPDLDNLAVEVAEDEPSAAKVGQYTQDLVLRILHQELSHEDFEHFTADLLRTLGYRARVTQFVADGGVDILAHKDDFGLEPGLIKVQCKHTTASLSSPEVSQLLGNLHSGEVGLFVSLGSFTASAIAKERQSSNLRLLPGSELVELTLSCYDDLPPRWKALFPLRRVLVVDREQDGY